MKRPRGFETIKASLKQYAYPPIVVVEVTNLCNLQCVMCPHPRMTRPSGIMQKLLFEKIVDDIALNSPNDTQLWIAFMGEPLILKQKAIDYLKYAVDRGLKHVNLNTNLLPAGQALCEQLVQTQLNRVIVSLDAATPETYASIRKGGDFHKAMQNIDYLLAAKEKMKLENPEIIIQFIVQKENAHEVEGFKNLFKGKRVALKIREKLGWANAIRADNLSLPEEARDYPCPWSNRGFTVHVTGQVGQCDASWDGVYYFGDLNYQSISEVWNGKLADLRRRHWNLDFDFAPCKSCKDWQCGRSEMIYSDQKSHDEEL